MPKAIMAGAGLTGQERTGTSGFKSWRPACTWYVLRLDHRARTIAAHPSCKEATMKYSLVFAAMLATTAYATPPDPLSVENTEMLTATVASIDQEKRLVTLKADNGRTQTIEVGPDVENLAQVKAGDKVVVRYYEG